MIANSLSDPKCWFGHATKKTDTKQKDTQNKKKHNQPAQY